MTAAVCVMVTVPTEQEELREHLQRKHYHRTGVATGSCWQTVDLKVRQHNSRALELHDLKENAPLEQVLRRIVYKLRLEQVFWSQDVTGDRLQARFDLMQDERYECLLCTLQEWGIGERPGTHVTALNCLDTRFKFGSMSTAADKGGGATATAATSGSEIAIGYRMDASGPEPASSHDEGQRLGWQSFMDSVRCRLNVNQVVRVVRRDATINFDFVVLLMAAALLSCVGLVENSFLFLSSSMLISPLMGPIIAAIFGTVIGDRGLRWLGIRNELIGIGISVFTGFLFGAAICLCGIGTFFVMSSGFTEEIISRCETHSLAIGVCTALASGAAAAIGVLGGNTGSLVGVAISASLLPPAVNAGLLWAIALCSYIFHLDAELLKSLSKRHIYSQQLHVELFWCATVSMALTLLNIVCVWLMGVVVLRIKEVAPAVQRDQQFWRHDVRLAREVAQRDPQLHNAIDRLDTDERRLVDLDAPQYHNTWSPGMVPPTRLQEPKENITDYHTVHGFQDFCITLHKLKTEMPRSSSPPLPSFIDVFTPRYQTDASRGALARDSNRPIDKYCSLPDLRRNSALAEPTTTSSLSSTPLATAVPLSTSLSTLSTLQLAKSSANMAAEETKSRCKILRNVHWGMERGGEQQPQSSSMHSRSTDTFQRPSGQVLLPLPPDRRLQLLTRRSSDDSDHSHYEHEFNV